MLRHLLEWARLRSLVTINAAGGIPRLYRGGDRAGILWSQADRDAFDAVASAQVTDALDLACETGLRLADLASLTWSEVGEKAIAKLAAKSTRRKRRRVIIPITRELRQLLDRLQTRARAAGVETVLVNGFGREWSADGLGKRIGEARDRANGGESIRHSDGRVKHLHDCRGTFATRLILAGFTDQEAARVLGWAPERVGNIRHVYVDEERTIVALADKLQGRAVKRTVKRKPPGN